MKPVLSDRIRHSIQRGALAVAKFAGYSAARPSRTLGSRPCGWGRSSIVTHRERVVMGELAETLVKDSDFGINYIFRRRQYCSANLKYVPATGDTGLDAELTDYLDRQFVNGGINCSMQSAFSRVADVELPTKGDGALVWLRDETQMRLMEVGADQIGEHYTPDPVTANGLRYSNGMYFNQRNGIRVGFKIYDREAYYTFAKPRDYPASEVIYFQDNIFPSDRGVTKFHAALLNVLKREKIWTFTLDTMAQQSKIAAIASNNSGEPAELSYDSDQYSDGTIDYVESFSDGAVVKYQFNGDSYQVLKAEHPGDSFLLGIKHTEQNACLSVGFPYSFLRSASDIGGAPVRLEINQAGKEIERIQNEVHRPRLDIISTVYILDAVERGIFRPRENIDRGTWYFPNLPIADAFKDSMDDIKSVRAGQESDTRVLGRYGTTPERIMQDKERETILAYETLSRVNIELANRGVTERATIADIRQTTDNPQVSFQLPSQESSRIP